MQPQWRALLIRNNWSAKKNFIREWIRSMRYATFGSEKKRPAQNAVFT